MRQAFSEEPSRRISDDDKMMRDARGAPEMVTKLTIHNGDYVQERQIPR